MRADTVDFQAVNQVLGVSKEGGLDVVQFLDALCWGNKAVVDPATRSVRTNPMRNDRLATVVSCWLSPP